MAPPILNEETRRAGAAVVAALNIAAEQVAKKGTRTQEQILGSLLRGLDLLVGDPDIVTEAAEACVEAKAQLRWLSERLTVTSA